ncbi:anti-sigma regulatory factor (Ser/Thr protein kinase) [Kitasatospora sp. MAP12-15]|uniref:ATP-binding protein n=1 Tax=unclassified Kitasatospora TaxID=2633591 RepID=UPI002472EC58|nr:ATP-binding protein [Kitasatospora sp. MAP12-44]MDH6113727.1 anti-sigma regulatory factor (Ser/Thr protein kinase) [Kitasatospora sp. MAP12-44]
MGVDHDHDVRTSVFVAVPESVPIARRFAVDAARKSGWAETDVIALLVSELATNSVHAAGAFAVVVFTPCEDDAGHLRLRMEVVDDCLVRPVDRGMAPDSAESGRGIPIVAALAEEWHSEERGNGKAVCITLREEAQHERRRRYRAGNSPAALAS